MKADNSIAFFKKMKAETEALWEHIDPNDPFGPSVAPGSKWKPGLSEQEIKVFEAAMGFIFPEPVRNLYRTMNGLDRQYFYIDEDNKATPYVWYYSFPDDLDKIKSCIEWIHERTGVNPAILKEKGISRIFPVWGHRCIMVDEPGHPVLSMHGDDIVFWAPTLAAACRIDLLQISSHRLRKETVVRFWYPGWRQDPGMPKQRRSRGIMTKWLRKMKQQRALQCRAMG